MKFPNNRACARFLGAIAVAIATASCSLLRPSVPFGIADLQPLPAEQASPVLANLAQESAGLKSFRLAGKLTVHGGGKSIQVTQTVLFERPRSLRAEVFSGPVNTWSGIVLSKDDTFLSYVAEERTAYEGPISVCAAQQVLSVPLLPDEFALWLVGHVALPEDAAIKSKQVLQGTDGSLVYAITLQDGRLFEILAQQKGEQGKSLALRAFDVRRARDRKLVFSSVRQGDVLEFTIPEQGVRGSFSITKRVLNPDLSMSREKLFSFSPPPGSTVEKIKGTGSVFCGGR